MPSSLHQYEAIPSNSNGTSPSTVSSVANMRDCFDPPLHSPTRQSSSITAIFNLTNSLLGGGTLSLPFVFAKCGIAVSFFLVIFSMSLSIFSLNIICQLSQKLGCSSYSEVMEKTLGSRAKNIATYCLVVMLFLVIIAYLILIRDVSSELFEFFTPDNYEVSILQKNMILTTLALVSFPLMTADSLHSLRYASYCGATCILLLLGCLCHRAIQRSRDLDYAVDSELLYAPNSVMDILTALPITFIGFLCHFNVNGILCDLARPQDIRFVTRTTVCGTATVFLLFGFAGYVFARGDTADNILKNFSAKDPVLMGARLGLSITLMSQLPIMVIPCRKTLYPLLWPDTNKLEVTRRRRAHSHDVIARHLSSPRDQEHPRNRSSSHGLFSIDYFSTHKELDDMEVDFEVEQGLGVHVDSSSLRVGLTLLILSLTLIVSQSLPGVSVVWTIAGSTLTIVICYLLPSAAYITTWKNLDESCRVIDTDVIGCDVMFAIGVIFMILCTPQALHNAFSG